MKEITATGSVKSVTRGIIGLIALSIPAISNSASEQEFENKGLNSMQCATRISLAITGKAPTMEFLNTKDPQGEAEIDKLIATAEFNERFARYSNSAFNEGVGESSHEDAPYHMALYALQKNLKWEEIFIGKFNVIADSEDNVSVVADENGLGYVKSQAWIERYAGNEGNGIRINTAYRVMQNAYGLEMIASNLPAEADTTVEGRNTTQPCKSCHFDQVTALDPVAEAFPDVIRNVDGAFLGLAAARTEPREVLGVHMVTTQEDLMKLLVGSKDHKYFACQMAFKYLTGRHENSCSKSVMDTCLEAYQRSGLIQDAVKTIVRDESFCQ